MSEERREYTVRGLMEQRERLMKEEERRNREAPIVISQDEGGNFCCERAGDKVRFDDPGKLVEHVAELLAWRRDEHETLRYPVTAEKFVVDLIDSGQGTSVEIPFDVNLSADQLSNEGQWRKPEEVWRD